MVEGTRVRLSGQDSGRGTFSQRHAVLYDTQTGATWAPLSELRSESKPEARFEVFDSSLSEEGVLGFEYGYTVVAREALVMWEAQFGDFVNGAQTIIDQYIAASEDKWMQTSRLTMLLPHGYEGQGPEHSSARLERFLQLCAENNLQVCYPTTPAQYFHLLRRQVRPGMERPLVVITPKSLLRLPAAASSIDEFISGGFLPVIEDPEVKPSEAVTRIVLCSGKVYYDLIEARRKASLEHVAVMSARAVLSVSANTSARSSGEVSGGAATCLGTGRTKEHGRLDVCRAASGRHAAGVRASNLCWAEQHQRVRQPVLTRFISSSRPSLLAEALAIPKDEAAVIEQKKPQPQTD